MGSITSKIHITYEIYDPPSIVYPNDTLSGKITLSNTGNKEKKLKKVYIELLSRFEHYERLSEHDPDSLFTRKRWMEQSIFLKKYRLEHPQFIKSGEKIEIGFVIQLPSKWKPIKGKKYRDWHLALFFLQKTGLISNVGTHSKDAICILPVEQSDIPPSQIFLKKTGSSIDMSREFQEQPGKIICPRCGMENRATANFCIACRMWLTQFKFKTCSSCGKRINLNDKYCKHCGATLVNEISSI